MSNVNSSPKPDYTALSFRGALMRDNWNSEGDPEWSSVPSYFIGEVGRASNAVRTIARLVHNSNEEPQMSGAEPLGRVAHSGLLDALEIVGQHLTYLEESMRNHARYCVELKRMQEVNHD